MTVQISLTPNFSWVPNEWMRRNRFNRFAARGKPLKRLEKSAPSTTRLKPGVNQKSHGAHIVNHK